MKNHVYAHSCAHNVRIVMRTEKREVVSRNRAHRAMRTKIIPASYAHKQCAHKLS